MIMYLCRTPSEINVKTDSGSTSNVEASATILTSAETIKVTSFVHQIFFLFFFKISIVVGST